MYVKVAYLATNKTMVTRPPFIVYQIHYRWISQIVYVKKMQLNYKCSLPVSKSDINIVKKWKFVHREFSCRLAISFVD